MAVSADEMLFFEKKMVLLGQIPTLLWNYWAAPIVINVAYMFYCTARHID